VGPFQVRLERLRDIYDRTLCDTPAATRYELISRWIAQPNIHAERVSSLSCFIHM
jgi:hypothetical protein